jgi:hypothetical protein
VRFLEADETNESVGERQLLRFYCGCLSLQDEPLAGALALHRLSHIVENPRYSKYLTEKSKGRYILHAKKLLKLKAFPLPKEHEVSNESHLLLLSFLSMIHARVVKNLFDEVTPVSPMSLTEQEQVIIKSIQNSLEGYQQICGLIEL